MKKINYIAELSLPSTSAYSIHVMKMCDAFTKAGYKTTLYTYNKKKNLNLFKFYNCNKFEILALNFFKSNNFFTRIFFAIKIFLIFIFKGKNNIIISRSIISAIFLSLIHKKIILEIHHELNGISKQLFNFIKNSYLFKNIKIIFISKNLPKKFNIKKNKYLILDDAVDLDDFDLKSFKKNIKNTCAYCGSFAKGKGIENILKISKLTKNIKYHLYGDFINSNLDINEIKKYKNVIYKGFVKYKDVPKVLSKYEVLLLPYSKKVYVRSKNIEVGKYMSPMKLFDYLASKKIIVASNLKVYNHILSKKNSVLIESDSPIKWAQKLELIFNNKKRYLHLKQKAFETVKKYSWKIRVKKIIEFSNA